MLVRVASNGEGEPHPHIVRVGLIERAPVAAQEQSLLANPLRTFGACSFLGSKRASATHVTQMARGEAKLRISLFRS